MSLKGKVAWVTGVNDVPATTIALALAKAGAKVAMEGGGQLQERVLRTVETFGGEALPVRGDSSSESDVRHMLSNVEAVLGPVDILVNAYGARAAKKLSETTAEDWENVAVKKTRAAFLCSRAVLPGMVSRGGGHIISIASVEALRGEANHVAMSASENALAGFSEALAQEAAKGGVKVSLVCAGGPVAGQGGESASGLDPEEVASAVVQLASQTGPSSGARITIQP